MKKKPELSVIPNRIMSIRGSKVILDADLATIYGVSTKALNQAVRRNQKRFPRDFAFRLSMAEKKEVVTNCDHLALLKFSTALPYAFTEHGAVMAANILNSATAVRMSVYVVRAFLRMREIMGGSRELARQLVELERQLTARLDGHETAIVDVLQRIMRLIEPPAVPAAPEPARRRIGFRPD